MPINLQSVSAQIALDQKVNLGATIVLHRGFHVAKCRRLERMGIKVKRNPREIPDEWFWSRIQEPRERDASVMIEEELSPTNFGASSLYKRSEEFFDIYGIDEKEWQVRVAKPQQDAFERRSAEAYERGRSLYQQLCMEGLPARQLATALLCYELRALDPATDTNFIGTDYLHDWFRVLRLSGQLLPFFDSFDIPAGFREYVLPSVDDPQFVFQGASTSDTLDVNTAVKPTAAQTKMTPVKFQATTFWNGEFNEDSLADAELMLRAGMIRAMGLLGDAILLNGDTTNTAGANINASGGTLTLGTKDPRVAIKGQRGIYYRGTHGGKAADTFTGGTNGGGDASTLADFFATKALMGKYAAMSQYPNLAWIGSVQSRTKIADDARGSNFGQGIIDKEVWAMKFLELDNSTVTHASTSNVQNYAQWLKEGCPVNLTTAGVYDDTTKTKSTWVITNKRNFVTAWKRHLKLVVLELPLDDKFAISATTRFDHKEIIANEPALAVAFNVL